MDIHGKQQSSGVEVALEVALHNWCRICLDCDANVRTAVSTRASPPLWVFTWKLTSFSAAVFSTKREPWPGLPGQWMVIPVEEDNIFQTFENLTWKIFLDKRLVLTPRIPLAVENSAGFTRVGKTCVWNVNDYIIEPQKGNIIWSQDGRVKLGPVSDFMLPQVQMWNTVKIKILWRPPRSPSWAVCPACFSRLSHPVITFVWTHMIKMTIKYLYS